MEGSTIIKFLKNKKGMGWIVLLTIAAALMMIFGNFLLDSTSESKTTSKQDPQSSQSSITENYRKSLEESVRLLCAQVNGTANVSVLLTLEAGTEYVYAQNIDSNGNDGLSSDYVISSSNGKPSGLLIKENYPKICGIAVVCSGGDNITVKKEITDLLSAAFNLPSNRIYVASGK